MIYPTSSDLLRCIDQTLLTISAENTPHTAVKSALATSRHLIRHVELRLHLERAILLDDIEKTRELLGKIVAYLESHARQRPDLTHSIRAVLGETAGFPSSAAGEFDAIHARAKTLRELVYSALAQLQGVPVAEKATKPYGDIRQSIRDYMRYQIEQEDRLIHPAFCGKGPRR